MFVSTASYAKYWQFVPYKTRHFERGDFFECFLKTSILGELSCTRFIVEPRTVRYGRRHCLTQAGFNRVREGNQTVIEFLQNIFLTPATRLYKIGILLRSDASKAAPEGWKAFVFDSNISLSNREAAAAYFYEAFLGCALPSDGSYETAKFFDLTKEFVRKSDLDPEKKRDVLDSLHVFVRDDQEVTFTSNQFGDRYLPEALRDPYSDFMRNRKFTPNAVVRDVTQMGNRLRRRRLRFGTDIELSATPEALANRVSISAIAPSEAGVEGMWTQVIIRAVLSGEQ